MKNSILLRAGGTLLAALSLAASAQDAPTKTLTRDELRTCLDSQDALQARGDDIKKRAAKLREEDGAIRAEDEQLRQEQKRAEESSMPGVRDRFERKVRQHTNRIKTAEEESKSVRADADAFTKDLDAHNAKCGGVAVNRADREAVMKEREAAGKK